MATYNSANSQHRIWLAQNILNILQKWGFEMVKEDHALCRYWEFILIREDKKYKNKFIIVYTSIDKMTGAMRASGQDRIRIVIRDEENVSYIHRRIARVNRVGEFTKITNRLIEGIKQAQHFMNLNYRKK